VFVRFSSCGTAPCPLLNQRGGRVFSGDSQSLLTRHGSFVGRLCDVRFPGVCSPVASDDNAQSFANRLFSKPTAREDVIDFPLRVLFRPLSPWSTPCFCPKRGPPDVQFRRITDFGVIRSDLCPRGLPLPYEASWALFHPFPLRPLRRLAQEHSASSLAQSNCRFANFIYTVHRAIASAYFPTHLSSSGSSKPIVMVPILPPPSSRYVSFSPRSIPPYHLLSSCRTAAFHVFGFFLRH